MSHLGEASDPARPDIYSAVLLLSTVVDDAGSVPSPQTLESSLEGVAYAPPGLDSHSSLAEMPWRLVRAALWQLYANLLLLTESDETEVVHQARIGWRRLRSCGRLLRTMRDLPPAPPVEVLRELIDHLRELRDTDVARYDILPRVAELMPGGVAAMNQEWQQLYAALETEAKARRTALRRLLVKPAIGDALWEQVLWLLQLREYGQQNSPPAHGRDALVKWARHHVGRLHQKFKHARARCRDAETQHRARIWAKRLRYASEDFGSLLPHAARKWHKEAARLQSSFGEQRDLQTAVALAERHGAVHIAPRIRQLASDLMVSGA